MSYIESTFEGPLQSRLAYTVRRGTLRDMCKSSECAAIYSSAEGVTKGTMLKATDGDRGSKRKRTDLFQDLP